MLRFDAYIHGVPAEKLNLSGAYLFGQESVPARAEITAIGGEISCVKRAPGASGLALLWEAGAAGAMMLPTTRLPDRKNPYNLNIELARARMMLVAKKREDWGLWDLPSAEHLTAGYDKTRKMLIEAIKVNPDNPGQAALLADECLAQAIVLAEQTTLFHAEAFLGRRRKSSTARCGFGGTAGLFSFSDAYCERLAEAVDFVSVPVPWKHTEPKERQTQFQQVDAWTEWCIQRHLPIHAGPLVSFDPGIAPEWLYIWEHDYETLREMIYEYVQRMVTRYAKRVRTWNVISGVHAHNSFNLSFEQIMELTRMSCSLVKKLSPRANVVIDLVMPWGEYYARNQRTIPPLLYADMCVQSGVKFDAFGVQLYMGSATDGMYVRDLMAISDMLDQFAPFSKPLHITACQVPSDTAPDRWDAWQGQAKTDQAGVWRRPWDPATQAEWLEAFYRVALSKPYIESICWRDLADTDSHYLPHGGLCRNDLTPKPAFTSLKTLRANMTPPSGAPASDKARRRVPPGETPSSPPGK